jgi:cytochrome P450
MTAFQTIANISGPVLPPIGVARTCPRLRTRPRWLSHSLAQPTWKDCALGEGKMSATFPFHPDYTRQILSNPNLFYSFSLEDIPFPFSDIEVLKSMTTALSLLNGEQHKRQRRLMAPAFHNNFLPIYVDQNGDEDRAGDPVAEISLYLDPQPAH